MPLSKNKRKEIVEMTNFVIRLCIIAGAQLSTAYNVGALFANGLERECDISDILQKQKEEKNANPK